MGPTLAETLSSQLDPPDSNKFMMIGHTR
jgi:hypothetical protein